MPTLTIRDVPEELHAALKERARRNRRSMNQQLIAELSALDADADERTRLEQARASGYVERTARSTPCGRESPDF